MNYEEFVKLYDSVFEQRQSVNNAVENIMSNNFTDKPPYKEKNLQASGDDISMIYRFGESALADHVISNRQILVGATHASLFINTLLKSCENWTEISVNRLGYYTPVQLIEEGDEARVSIEYDTEKGGYQFEAKFSVNEQSELVTTAKAFLSQCQFKFSQMDVASLYYRLDTISDIEKIYKTDPDAVWGPSYKSITSLWVNTEEAVAKFDVKKIASNHDYIFDPRVSNSILLSILPILEKNGISGGFLPYSIKEIHIADLSIRAGWVHVRVAKKNPQIFSFDADIINNEGRQVAAYRGFTLKKISSGDQENENENYIASKQIEEKLAASDSNKSPQYDKRTLTLVDRFLFNHVTNLLSSATDKEKITFSPELNFMEMGLDSTQLLKLSDAIGNDTGADIDPTIFFEYVNIGELRGFLLDLGEKTFLDKLNISAKDVAKSSKGTTKRSSISVENDLNSEKAKNNQRKPKNTNNNPSDIAIIGMNGTFPESRSAEEFWEVLLSEENLFREVPLDRWDVRPWFDPERNVKDKTYCKWGSFIPDVDQFDAGFFNISPREAVWMDPQHRILLQSVYATVEEAGYITSFRGSDTGVFVGMCFHDYAEQISEHSFPVDPHIGTGNFHTVSANRISYCFDLTGPSIAMDTACSSSLFALHAACSALKNGECKMAIVAGANLLLSSYHYRYFAALGTLSPTGRCNSFDADADGYVPGEAVASLLIRPLQDAEEAHDNIYAIIKGSAALHGGSAQSLTSPSVKGEENVIVKAWEAAGVDPETIGYIEAHGMGASLGDPIEVNSLKKAFSRYTKKKSFCAIGSAKAHIGHTEGAAGITGIFKLILQMNHRKIPRMPFFKDLNPYISLEDSALFINRESVDWEPAEGSLRRGGVSSFGFAGAYAHVVIEEYKNSEEVEGQRDYSFPPIFILTAKNKVSLRNKAKQLKQHLNKNKISEQDLFSVAYTLQCCRDIFDERIAFQADSVEELLEALNDYEHDEQQCNTVVQGSKDGSTSQAVLLEEDDELNALFISWLSNGKTEKFLSLWVCGLDFNWADLYGNNTPRVKPLPSYPFLTERYWFDVPEVKSQNVTAAYSHNDRTEDYVQTEESSEQVYDGEKAYSHLVASTESVHQCGEDNQTSSKNVVDNEDAGILADLPGMLGSFICSQLSKALSMQEHKIKRNISFFEYGADSIISVQFVSDLNKAFKIDLSTILLFDYNTISHLQRYLLSEYPDQIKKYFLEVAYAEDTSKRNRLISGTTDSISEKDRVSAVRSASKQSEDSKHIQSPAPCLEDTFDFVAIEGPGELDDIRWRKSLVAPLSPDQVRVNVKASSVNFADLLCIRGLYPSMPTYPFTLGFEASGVVTAVGSDIKKFRVGDQVIINMGATLGAFSSVVTCSEDMLIRKPSTLEFSEAATLPLAGATVVEIFSRVRLGKGERILIQAAAGSTGLMAVQYALSVGAEVFATTESKEKMAYLKSLGVHHVVNYREEDFEHKVGQLTKGEGVNVVINTLPGEVLSKGLRCLSAGGQFIDIAMNDPITSDNIDIETLDNNRLFYSLDLRKLSFDNPEQIMKNLYVLMDWIEKGIIKPVAGKIFPSEDIQQAFNYLDQRNNIGKVVLSYDNDTSKHTLDRVDKKINTEKDTVKERLASNESLVSAEEKNCPIAIIGMSGRFANCENLDELWSRLADGDNLISSIDRWDFRQRATNEDGCFSGGLLNNIDCFDASFFNINGIEANYMDPQQRLFMQEAWIALEDAAYAGDVMSGSRCGVYVGCCVGDYLDLIDGPRPAQAFWGNAGSIIPARISYYLNLLGPAIAIDTACSSSLVAIHNACLALWSQEIDMAIAGGVFVMSTSRFFDSANNAKMLSPSANCYAFDSRADGFVPGEGVGAVILKKLSDAKGSRDHIHGLITASGINQDGLTNGIIAPSSRSQERLQSDTYKKFGIDVRNISYVEAHGTGTKLGDPIEFSALNRSFGGDKAEPQYCALGSIKTNIGHTATAAGIAGVLKILLSLRHKKILPNVNFNLANDAIDLTSSPFYVPTSLRDWSPHNGVRRAAISSYGFSGTNAHMVIEEAPQESPSLIISPGFLVVLSARTEKQLRIQVRQLVGYCEQSPESYCGHLSFTLFHGRKHLEYRLACISDTYRSLVDQLGMWLESASIENPRLFFANTEEQRLDSSTDDELVETWFKRFITSNSDEETVEALQFFANKFTRGYDIDYRRLYDGGEFCRLALPTYPFSQDRYWLPKRTLAVESPTEAEDKLHPMIHRQLDGAMSGTLDADNSKIEKCYITEFSKEDFFLKGHVVKGHSVLPAVAYLEMIQVAFASAFELPSDCITKICNVVWMRPMVVDTRGLTVTTKVKKKNDYLWDVSIEGDSTYCRGNVEVIRRPDNSSIDIDELRDRLDVKSISKSAFYKKLDNLGFSYGEGHQAVETLYTGEREILAKLTLPVSLLKQSNPYKIHPAIADSALQASLIYILDQNTPRLSLPFSLESITVVKPCTSYGWAHIVSRRSENGHERTNIEIYDVDGDSCLSFSGLISRQEKNELFALTQLEEKPNSASIVMTPHWEVKALEHAVSTDRLAGKHLVWVSPDLSLDLGQWKRLMPEATCSILPAQQINASAVLSQMFDQLQTLMKKNREDIILQILLPADKDIALQYGVAALLRTVVKEDPRIKASVSCIDECSPELLADTLRQEKYSMISATELASNMLVKISERSRRVLVLQELDAVAMSKEPAPRRESLWTSGGVYLISGGNGGIARSIVESAVNASVEVTLILCSRSQPDSTLTSMIASAKRRAVTKIHHRCVDVSSREHVIDLVKNIISEHGGLNGIIHSAGIVKDELLVNKSLEHFTEVVEPKVLGAVNLDEASRGINLDFFLMFSSISSVLGNAGQADYSAANGFLDGYAVQRAQDVRAGLAYGSSVSINWPLWDDGGMKVGESAETIMKEVLGIFPMPSAIGLDMLSLLLMNPSTKASHQYVVAYGNAKKIRRSFIHESSQDPVNTTPASSGPYKSIGNTRQLDQSSVKNSLGDYIRKILCKTVEISEDLVGENTTMDRYGLDSLMVMEMTTQLEKCFGPLPKTLFFEYQTLGELIDYFISNHNDVTLERFGSSPDSVDEITSKYLQDNTGDVENRYEDTDTKNSDIAVIGISGRFPQAENLQIFWQNLKEGRDCVTLLPHNRWGDTAGKYNSDVWGGFIDGVDMFDPLFFNISQREAEMMDPQERVFLQCAYSAIEDAGYTCGTLGETKGSKTNKVGVFVGVMYEEYQFYGVESSLRGKTQALSGSFSSVANRLSYFGNFHGPSMAVDSMCSSSLTAIHLGCQSLLSGESHVAVVGGVNLALHPNKYQMLSQNQFLSSRGRCESFAEGGDGYIPGEAVAAVVLKPAVQAMRDGDQIHGVVKATAVNHGGKTHGYSVPNPKQQANVVKRALADACIEPSTVQYIEAHGTGTALGDPIEIAGLNSVFARADDNEEFELSVGSVKSNIGHCESAAAIAGLTKLILQLRHHQFVPSIHADTLNPNIDFDKGNIKVQRRKSAWPSNKNIHGRRIPRRAGLSSFGAGGSNAHLVIEEKEIDDLYGRHLGRNDLSQISACKNNMFVFSARTTSNLRKLAERYIEFIDSGLLKVEDLYRFAYTLQLGRDALAERLAFTASTVSEVGQKLIHFLSDELADGLYRGSTRHHRSVSNPIRQFDLPLSKSEQESALQDWVKGVNLDWTALYSHLEHGVVRRMSLPTYPFSENRCWVPDLPPAMSNESLTTSSPDAPALIHYVSQTENSFLFESSFSGKEAFLNDHKVKGLRILPASVFIELLHRAFTSQTLAQKLPNDSSTVVIEDLHWSGALTVNTTKKTLFIELVLDHDDHTKFSMFSTKSKSVNATELSEKHCYGRSLVVHDYPLSTARKPEDFAILQKQMQPVGDVYAEFKRLGIEYGPSHKVITSLYVNEHEVLATLENPNPQELAQFGFAPNLMDGAFQAAIGFVWSDKAVAPAQLSVPAKAARIVLLKTEADLKWAHLTRVNLDENKSMEKLVFDLDIYDSYGELCVQITHFEVSPIKNIATLNKKEYKTLTTADTSENESLITLIPRWEVASPQSVADNHLTGTICCLGDVGSISTHLNTVSRPDLELVFPEVDLSISIDHIVGKLQSLVNFDHILLLMPSSVSSDANTLINTLQSDFDNGDIESHRHDFLAAQNTCIYGLLNFIKALQVLGYTKRKLTLTIVTRAAQAVHVGERVNLAHAALPGIIGCLAKEQLNWSVRHFDITGEADIKEILETPSTGNGDGWYHRGSEWYQQKLSQCKMQRHDHSGFKSNGTYVFIGGAGGIGHVFSEYLIRYYDAQVIWLGRKAKNDEIEEKIRSLSMIGKPPEYIQADATDLQQISVAYKTIKEKGHNINGVFHSAIVLDDQTLMSMDEDQFRKSFDTKMLSCLNLANTFSKEKLDFVLFFSSMVSFGKPPGQANYTAGSVFKDVFAQALDQIWDCAVKVVNWGFWDTVGSVSTDYYRERMTQLGFGGIRGPEACQFVEQLLNSRPNQLAFFKSLNNISGTAKDALLGNKIFSAYPVLKQNTGRALKDHIPLIVQSTKLSDMEECLLGDEIESLVLRILAAQLNDLDFLEDKRAPSGGLAPHLNSWLHESLRFIYERLDTDAIEQHRAGESIKIDELWARWIEIKFAPHADNNRKSVMTLMEAGLKSLPEILRGNKKAHEVLFPGGSLDLVESAYKGGLISDVFNEAIAEHICEFITRRQAASPHQPIRILEVGAGTGATTGVVLKRINQLITKPDESIGVYNFTDVSIRFLQHAEKKYGPIAPFLSYQIFDMQKPIIDQNIDPGSYDIVIATNVLHASRDLRDTLRNVKATMSTNGQLFINEITKKSIFAHVTFGLLDGWWLFDDAHLRIPGCPASTAEQWNQVLLDVGFDQVHFPCSRFSLVGQQIISATSDGVNFLHQSKDASAVEKEITTDSHLTSQVTISEKEKSSSSLAAEDRQASIKHLAVTKINELVAEALKISPVEIDPNEPLGTYGVDSIVVLAITESFNQIFYDIDATIFFELQTTEEISSYLLDTQRETFERILDVTSTKDIVAQGSATAVSTKIGGDERQSEGESSPSGSDPRPQVDSTSSQTREKERQVDDIAIIGISGRFPKAKTVDELWERLSAGDNCISEVPVERWDWRDYYGEARGELGTIYTRWGGFIDGIDEFDPYFFNIAPSMAELMDPQERLFLQEAYRCIEDAGHTPQSLSPEQNVGVFVGVMNSNYPAGARSWSIANRVSFALDFHGPSVAFDSACSSSLTAIHFAIESIRNNSCDSAVAGGVNLIADPYHYFGLASMNMLSDSAECKSFGKGADGFVAAESIAAIVLRPLATAVDDGDHIYAVLAASSINSSGRTNGYTVPNPYYQAKCIESAIKKAGVDIGEIGYVEAHGTGTQLGDPIEIRALSTAFGKVRSTPCPIGSIKSNIGHTESAAGVTGLIKILLQIRSGEIAPSINAEEINPMIDFNKTPFRLQQQLSHWPRTKIGSSQGGGTMPRVASLSSFGAGGANAHLVVKEHIPAVQPFTQSLPVAIVISAKTKDQLRRRVQQLQEKLLTSKDNPQYLEDFAYTLQVGREVMKEKYGFVAKSLSEALEKLNCFLTQSNWHTGAYYNQENDSKKIVSSIISDLDFKETLDKWFHRKNYDKLLTLWAAGADIDWLQLYRQERRRRISLPTYPFDKERFWLAEDFREKLKNNKKDESQPLNRPSLITFNEHWEATPLPVNEVIEPQVIVWFISEKNIVRSIQREMISRYQHCQIIFISEGSRFLIDSKDHISVRHSNEQDLTNALKSIAERFNRVDGIFYHRSSYELNSQSSIVPLTVLIKCLIKSKLLTLSLYLCGYAESSFLSCYFDGWIGFQKSLHLIIPDVASAVIIHHAGEGINNQNESLGSIFDEWQQQRFENCIYLGRQRTTREISLIDLELNKTSLNYARQVYIIFGGAGGIGFIISRHLASNGANIVMVGRRPLDSSIEDSLKTFDKLSGNVSYVTADICDEEAVLNVFNQTNILYGSPYAVLHIAGHESHQTLSEKTKYDIIETTSSKVDGVLVLDRVIDDIAAEHKPKIVCYFGSVSATIGDFGAGDYAFSNRFQQSYSKHKNRENKSIRYICIAWPLWRNGGFGFPDRTSEEIYLKSSGLNYLEDQDALAVFDAVMYSSHVNVGVLCGDYERLCHILGIDTNGNVGVARQLGSGDSENYCIESDCLDSQPTSGPSDQTINADSHDEIDAFSQENTSPDQQPLDDLRKIVQEVINIPAGRLSADMVWSDMGFDSISLAKFSKAISKEFDIEVTPNLLFSKRSLSELEEYLSGILTTTQKDRPRLARPVYGQDNSANHLEKNPTQHSSEIEAEHPSTSDQNKISSSPDEIAIIGMNGRFPGADSIENLWQNWKNSNSATRAIPIGRKGFNQTLSDGESGIHAGLLSDISGFEPLFFEISPTEAVAMDPQQRLILQTSWHALEHAGYLGQSLVDTNCGVFIGAEESGYDQLTSEHKFINSNRNATLGARVAYALDLTGPSFSVNAACSSGLVALHQACQSLQLSECDMAVAGAVSIIVDANNLRHLSGVGLLSSSGRCSVFDESADGMVPAEGVAAVILKPLQKALIDGDAIYGTIVASGINSNGKTNGLLAPNPDSQAALLKTVLKKSGLAAKDIDLVITHSNGSQIGDAIEIQAMSDTWKSNATENYAGRKTHLSSIKPVVGHNFSASGLTDLIALLKAFEQETMPAMKFFNKSNPYIDFSITPFTPLTENRAWPARSDERRFGLISTTGINGTNSAAIIGDVEHCYARKVGRTILSDRHHLIFLSAPDSDRLRSKAYDLSQLLSEKDFEMEDLAFTLSAGREHMQSRIAWVVNSCKQLRHELQEFVDGKIPCAEKGCFETHDVIDSKGEINYPNDKSSPDVLLNVARKWVEGCRLLRVQQGSARRVSLPLTHFRNTTHWSSKQTSDNFADDEYTFSKMAQTSEKDTVQHSKLVKQEIRRFLTSELGVPSSLINDTKPLRQYGVDSVIAIKMGYKIETDFSVTLVARDYFENPTIDSLAARVSEIYLDNRHPRLEVTDPDSNDVDPEIISAIERLIENEVDESILGERK